MKRNLLALSLFSLSALALFSSNVDAFWCCHKHTTRITCRPDNAFTPICWGNLVCDGCCPSPCGVASGCMPMGMGMPSYGGCGMAYMSPGFAPPATATDRGPMPDIRSTPFTPPMPMPVPSGPNVSMNPYYGVAQANYNPYTPIYYTPVYYPPYQGWSQPMPYYWYGAGR